MSQVLGRISFLDVPDVNGTPVLVNAFVTAGQLGVTQGSGNVFLSIANDTTLPGTGAFRMPLGTTAQRTGAGGGAASAGDTRFNTTLGYVETYNGTAWVPPGAVLQTVTGTIAATSGTGTYTLNNTAPTSANGFQIWSQSFTPLSATSKIIVTYSLTAASSVATATVATWLLAGTTNIATVAQRNVSATTALTMHLQEVYQPGSTAAITFSARIGGSAAGTTYANIIGTTTLGGSLVSPFIIQEIAA